MSTRSTITVAVVALNEAANLPGWLASTRWADARLVVDGGSRDATLDVARQGGARVLERAFDNFARQRNFALAACSTEWMLFVDADERPTPALVDELRWRLSHARVDAFRVPIRSRIFGRPFRFGGTQDDRPLRLVRRGAGWFQGHVHETFQCRGPRGTLSYGLTHVTYPDLPAYCRKVERYAALEVASRLEARCPPRLFDGWWRAPREVFRRLLWKQGWLDGPLGWRFAWLSGWSEWVVAERHRRAWHARHAATPVVEPRPVLAPGR